MKIEKIKEWIAACALFRGVCIDALPYDTLFTEEHYMKGQKVRGKASLCVLISGKLRVGAQNGIGRAVINELSPGAVFGYASLYDEEGAFDSDIRAVGSVTLLRMHASAIEELIARQPTFARNIIAAQAEKIRFLNRRIYAFSAPDGEKKLLCYLSSLEKDEDGAVSLPLGMAPLAKRLGMGRASLYRAFERAEKENKLIKIGEKRWRIN